MSIVFNSAPFLLDATDPDSDFPDVELAARQPDGLLAIGGDLTPRRLLKAYRQGIFPWFDKNQPLLWWAPNPRAVLFPDRLKVSRSLRKTLANKGFQVRFDHAFSEVLDACAAPRPYSRDTWIDSRIKSAYTILHQLGHAHSAETWLNGELAGGLYGVAIGCVFFGESMFYRERDASKVAFVALVQTLREWGYHMIDCQLSTRHLLSLGACEIPRREFSARLEQWCQQTPAGQAWSRH